MAVQLSSYTKNQYQKAERLAEMVSTFTRGRDKATGIEYVTIPSSDDPEHVGHNTNGLSCTCEGFDKRGLCSHALAVTMWSQRQESARIAVAQQRRRENGKCKQAGCIQTSVRPGGRCSSHNAVLCEQLGY